MVIFGHTHTYIDRFFFIITSFGVSLTFLHKICKHFKVKGKRMVKAIK